MPKLSDHVFPESLWKAFGEHMGEEEEEGGIRKKEEEEQEEEEASWEPLRALLGPPGSFLGASWRPLWGRLGPAGGFLEASLAVLGRSWPV